MDIYRRLLLPGVGSTVADPLAQVLEPQIAQLVSSQVLERLDDQVLVAVLRENSVELIGDLRGPAGAMGLRVRKGSCLDALDECVVGPAFDAAARQVEQLAEDPQELQVQHIWFNSASVITAYQSSQLTRH